MILAPASHHPLTKNSILIGVGVQPLPVSMIIICHSTCGQVILRNIISQQLSKAVASASSLGIKRLARAVKWWGQTSITSSMMQVHVYKTPMAPQSLGMSSLTPKVSAARKNCGGIRVAYTEALAITFIYETDTEHA